jgi:hypothetical protein
MILSSKTLEEHLKEEIIKTGYPLEVEISDLLEKEWVVFNNDTYLDAEERKSREIDIFAVHMSEPQQLVALAGKEKSSSSVFVMTELIVECKKTDTHAWVFFTRPSRYNWVGDGQIIDFLKIRSEDEDQYLDVYGLDLHYKSFGRVAHTYSEVKLQGESSGKSEIFEASNQLIKCARYHVEQQRESILRDASLHQIGIFFLAIALDGKLYEAIAQEGDVSLSPRDSILLAAKRHWSTGPQTSYLIDVVTKQSFSKYLKNLDSDIDGFRKHVASEEDMILSKLERDRVRSRPDASAKVDST